MSERMYMTNIPVVMFAAVMGFDVPWYVAPAPPKSRYSSKGQLYWFSVDVSDNGPSAVLLYIRSINRTQDVIALLASGALRFENFVPIASTQLKTAF